MSKGFVAALILLVLAAYVGVGHAGKAEASGDEYERLLLLRRIAVALERIADAQTRQPRRL